MRLLRLSATIALLLFVGATVGVLIAQEVSHTVADPTGIQLGSSSSDATDDTVSVERSNQSAPADTPEAGTPEAEDPAASDSGDIGSEATSAAAAASEARFGCVVDAVYFHNTLRCHTCRTIEETARAVLEAEFAEEFATGELRWSAINMERQPYFVEKFDLVKPTLILVRSVEDEQTYWVALDETWSLIRSELRFRDYVESETRVFLEGCP